MMDILQQAGTGALPGLHCITDLDSAGEDLGGFGHQCVELVHENQFDLSAGLAAQKHRKLSKHIESAWFSNCVRPTKNVFRTIQIPIL